jgi:MATE family multidrug resistance protein
VVRYLSHALHIANDAMKPEKQYRPAGLGEVLHVALPLVVSMGSFTFMQFCDRMFLARFSSISIQAALPAGILSFTLCCGFMELAGYANTFVAQYHGAGDRRGCSRAAVQSVFLAVFSWPLILLLIPLGRWMLTLAGHAPEVLAQELTYLSLLMAGGVTVPLGVAAATFFTGRGDTRTTMMANIVANGFNIALDYALIFGHWGFPRLGIRGAAMATIVSGFVGPAILLGLFFSRRVDRQYGTRAAFRMDFPLIGRMVRFGLPASVHLVLAVLAFSVFILLTGRLGETALAASNMAFSINMLAFMPLIGLGIAANTLVGKYQGQNDPSLAARATWTTLKTGLAYSMVIGGLYLLLPEFFYSFFTRKAPGAIPLEEVIPLGRVMLRLMALWGFLDAVNVILAGGLKGAGDTRFVMIYSLLASWLVFVLGEVLIVFVFRGSILQAWCWLTAHLTVLAVGYAWRFRSGRWKSIDLLGRRMPPPPHPAPEAVVLGE